MKKYRNYQLSAYNAVVIDEWMWFADKGGNGLYRMNIKGKDIELVDFFPYEENESFLFKKVINIENLLVFIPANAKYIYFFDYKKEKFVYFIDVQHDKHDYAANAIIYDRKIYIFPGFLGADITCIDIDNFSIQKRVGFSEKSQIINDKKELFYTRIIQSNNKVYFGICNTSLLGIYNVVDDDLEIIDCGINDVFAAIYINGYFWIISKEINTIFRYKKGGSLEKYQISGKVKSSNRQFNQIICWNNRIVVLPAFSEEILVERDNNFGEIYKEEEYDSRIPIMFDAVEVDNELWVLPFGNKQIIVIDDNFNMKEKVDFVLKECDGLRRLNLYWLSMYLEKGPFFENEELDLNEYVNLICKGY